MKTYASVAAILLVALVTAFTNPSGYLREPIAAPDTSLALTDPLPVDPNVRIGRLENGLVYYIRRNAEPEDRAELRLVLNAGSAQEDPDQRGLAHFIEHMLFNGTERFPEMELVNFMERIGMQFGPEVNAYTSFDETVYMLTIPTDSSQIVSRAFDVLEDWASRATLAAGEIEKERGVVIEEWRGRAQTASGRIQDQTLPIYLYGSPYKDRLPIGDTAIVRHAAPETIRRFYREWYRPGLMSVVAVGDFDPAQIEQLIRSRFARLKNPTDVRVRQALPVPPHEETLVKVVTDPEYPYTTIDLAFKGPAPVQKTVADYRKSLVRNMFNAMLNSRLDEIARRPGAPFVGAQAYRGSLVRPMEVYGLQAQVQDDSVLTGLRAMLTEAVRVRRHGFVESELERQKVDLLRAYQRAYDERKNTSSSSYAQEYVGNYLEQEPIPGIEVEYAIARKYIPTVTLTEVNQAAADLFAERNRAVIVTMPRKSGVKVPTEAEIRQQIAAVSGAEVAAYVEQVSAEPLIAAVPAPAAVKEQKQIAELGVTEITLANGVRVVMKPTDFKDDEVRFTASSPGGSSLVSDEDYLEASVASSLVVQSGLGKFDRTALEKKLAGKAVAVSPYISEVEEGLSGQASPQDLETLFQLVYLYFTAPRADSAALAAFQNQMRAYLTNRSANPQAAFQDTLQAALYGKNPRRMVPTLQMVNTLDFQRAMQIYHDRFADASDFTFVFAGNFKVDELTRLAQTYLGTLPARNRHENWKDVAPDPPKSVVNKELHKGVGQRSQVQIVFTGPFEYNRENRHALASLSSYLDIRLREILREEMGGVYGVNVGGAPQDRPDPSYTFTVAFGTDPARTNELVQAVFTEIDRLKREGASQGDVEKIREQQRRERETAVKTNAYWVSVLDFYYQLGKEDVRDILRYNELIENLKPAEIQEAARRYLDTNRYVKVTLYPEATPGG